MAEAPDPELDALLDDALKDFEKLPAASENIEPKLCSKTSDNHGSDASLKDGDFPKLANDLTEVLEQLVKDEPSLKAQFDSFQQKMEESMAHGSNEFPFDINEDMAKTFEDLTKDLEALNEDGNGDFSEIFQQMQNEADGGGDGEGIPGDGFMNMMKGMMQNLLSKDLLYPSLLQIKEKYPVWLVENKEQLSTEDYQKYASQEEIVCKLCQLFEEEGDSASVKNERMSRLISLMEQMQQYGHPPTEMMESIANEHGGISPSEVPGCCII